MESVLKVSTDACRRDCVLPECLNESQHYASHRMPEPLVCIMCWLLRCAFVLIGGVYIVLKSYFHLSLEFNVGSCQFSLTLYFALCLSGTSSFLWKMANCVSIRTSVYHYVWILLWFKSSSRSIFQCCDIFNQVQLGGRSCIILLLSLANESA